MARFKPFKGVRPKVGLADKVAALPYDVMNREEAKKMAEGNEYSFLHIARSEINLDDSVNPYDEIVYEIEDLISVADSGMIIPPKSTWFEPKLRSGLFVHRFF